MRKTIEEMVAEAAIKDVQICYGRANDRMDFELLRACFHADAMIDYGFYRGGVDDVIKLARQTLPVFLHTTHNTGSQRVEVDGDTAKAEHYAVVTHRIPADEHGPLRDFVTAVRYVDRLERRDGDWRISKRVLILDWTRTDPVAEASTEPHVPRGRRDGSDLSYL